MKPFFLILGTLFSAPIWAQETLYTFNEVDKLPSFAVCQQDKNTPAYDCYIEEVQRQIQAQIPKYKNRIGLINGSVNVYYVIHPNGRVEVKWADGQHRLVKPAREIVSNLKDIIPAEKAGEKVAAYTAIEVIFNWENTTKKPLR